jgi:5'-nucleotidase
MQNRREFIRRGALGAGLLVSGAFPFEALAGHRASIDLTILHTNDVHSRLEPFEADSGKLAGQGGVAARAAIIDGIRRDTPNVLLLDAGDIFQGTPYFNLYKGEPEIRAMTMMGYDAVTMGNHDFDLGVDGFARQLVHARFPVLTANYEFTGTPLEGRTQPWTVIKKAGLRIGVFGIGIELKGLVPDDLYGKTVYLEPLRIAQQTADHLRKKEHCDLVICLSHLGYSYESRKVSDLVLAKETRGIDLIIGGHTHTFLDEPTIIKNADEKPVIVNQVGWGGVRLGRIDFRLNDKKSAILSNAHTVVVRKQTIG